MKFTDSARKRLSALAKDAAKWITVHPNGKEAKGTPALIDTATGEILGGMGGKFNGKKIGEAHKGGEAQSTPQQAKPQHTTPSAASAEHHSAVSAEQNNSAPIRSMFDEAYKSVDFNNPENSKWQFARTDKKETLKFLIHGIAEEAAEDMGLERKQIRAIKDKLREEYPLPDGFPVASVKPAGFYLTKPEIAKIKKLQSNIFQK